MTVDELENELSKARRRLRLRNEMIATLHREIVRLSGPALSIDDEGAGFVPMECDLKPDAEGTIFSFSGLHLGGGKTEREFKGTLTDANYSVVYIKDYQQVWYQHGLFGIGDTRVAAFENIAEALGHLPRPWICIGNSAGGYAALFAGAVMQADRVVAFSAQTYVNAAVFKSFSREFPRARNFAPKDPENDLRNVLPNYASVPSKLIYGAENPTDSEQAERMADLPGIQLVPLPLKTHATAAQLRTDGKLLQTILEP